MAAARLPKHVENHPLKYREFDVDRDVTLTFAVCLLVRVAALLSSPSAPLSRSALSLGAPPGPILSCAIHPLGTYPMYIYSMLSEPLIKLGKLDFEIIDCKIKD